MKKWSLILLLITPVLLAACGGGDNTLTYPEGEAAALVDRSLETNEPCEAPCWYNIVPGETGRDEAYDLILELPFVEEGSVNNGLRSTPFDRVFWTSIPMGQIGEAYAGGEERKIEAIRYFLEYPYAFSNLVDRYGDPDGVFVVSNQQEGTVMIVWWQDAGIAARNRGVQVIDAETQVQEVIYFNPGVEPNTFIQQVRLITSGDYIEWEGYGSYAQ